jgi:high-affinity Fe2+/Pb2+ permease
MQDSILNSSFKEINNYVDTYKISSDVKAVNRFKLVIKSIPYIAVAVVGFIISWLMYCYNDMLPGFLYWIMLLIMVIVVAVISVVLWWIIGQPAKHRSCEKIEEGILADIPALF